MKKSRAPRHLSCPSLLALIGPWVIADRPPLAASAAIRRSKGILVCFLPLPKGAIGARSAVRGRESPLVIDRGGGKATSDRPLGSQGPRKGERAPPSAPGGGREGGRADHLILPRFVLLSSLPAPAPFSPQVAARRRRRRRRGERQVKGHCAAFPPSLKESAPDPIGPLLCLFSSPTLLSHFPISQERKGGCRYLHTGPHFCRRKAKALRF